MTGALRSLARRLLRSDDGAVAPLMALLILVLIGCTGLGIDIGRSYLVRARLIDALDAAGLAVGARLGTTDYTADAKKFVDANFKATYSGATVTAVSATYNATTNVISLAATATMPTAFMKLFGTKVVTVNATSEITRKSTGLELVMVLDNTGSMEMSSSMPGLKDAANSLVGYLFGSQTTADNLYIGLVPFSQTVNVGTSRAAWVKATSLVQPYYPAYWLGCVEARTNGLDVTDDVPLVTNANSMFTAYYSPDTTDWQSKYGSRSDWNKSYVNINDWLTDLGIARSVYYTDYQAKNQRGPGTYCPSEVTPMTNVKSKLTAGINAMKAAGSTMINEGAVWGWRMLSPKWRGYWGGDMLANGLPLDYNTKNMAKAAVIMTDGENSFGAYNYTAYGVLADAKIGSSVQSTAETALDNKLSSVCSSMKAAGITVYTVAYDNPDSATKSLLQSCATNTSYYFDAANTTDLKAKFQLIAGSLSNLRVSK